MNADPRDIDLGEEEDEGIQWAIDTADAAPDKFQGIQ